MGENIQEIGNALMKHNNFSFRILGLKMVKKDEKENDYLKRQLKEKQIRDRLYKLFLKLIDRESSKRLMQIDNDLSKMIHNFEEKTGWTMTSRGAYLDNCFNDEVEDKMNASNVFKIPRDRELGFYLPPLSEHHTYIEERMREGEMQFYTQNIEMLNSIHETMLLKERIMSGEYCLASTDIDESLVELIADYLGYTTTPKQTPMLRLNKRF